MQGRTSNLAGLCFCCFVIEFSYNKQRRVVFINYFLPSFLASFVLPPFLPFSISLYICRELRQPMKYFSGSRMSLVYFMWSVGRS
jgi:hypothetical protein